MDKRYQVFVSSTYDDLREARHEVMQALLELDCIPSGMELFPAADDDQWTMIRRVIDDCDYYVVVIAGRYGSTDVAGTSFTEREYRYALERGKPIIGFLHANPEKLPSGQCEKDAENISKLKLFRELVQRKLCRFWDTPPDLGGKVSRSIMQLIKSKPGVGWVRADETTSDDMLLKENLRLRQRIDALDSAILASSIAPPLGSDRFAQGEDKVALRFDFAASRYKELVLDSESYSSECSITWNEVFALIAPAMIDAASDVDLMKKLSDGLAEREYGRLKKSKQFSALHIGNFSIHPESFDTVKIQLRALGLIRKDEKKRNIRDQRTYWTLTPYGDTAMTTLRAIPKPPIQAP